MLASPPWLAAALGPALVALGYLSGSVLFGVLAARRAGVDLRTIGSGNVGATNVGRALGKRTGRVVMLLDALKGLLPAALAGLLLGADDPYTAATAFAAAFGHSYPIFHRFRGGKAAATGVGALLAVSWPAGLAAAVAFGVLRKLSRRASVGSLGGACAGLAVAVALHRGAPPTWLAGALTLLILWRHRDNLARLARGAEPPT